MTAPISTIGMAAPVTSQPTEASVNKDTFLTLLVAQLRNQDPFNTLKPHEFAAQLAQFSSVEQLTELNDAVAMQTEANQMTTFLGETSLSASLLGQHVVAEGNQVEVTEDGIATVQIEVGGQGGAGQLHVLDNEGRQVASVELGHVPPGKQTIPLPPGIAPGEYSYAVEVDGGEGVSVPVVTYSSGVVDGVYFRDGDIVLRIGAMEVPLHSLAEIRPATLPT